MKMKKKNKNRGDFHAAQKTLKTRIVTSKKIYNRKKNKNSKTDE